MVSIDNNELRIAENSEALYKAIADDFMQRANACIAEKGIFDVALSGGNTPKKLYSLLTTEPYRSGIAWDKIRFFFGDERYLPADDPDSNYFMAHKYLFIHVPIPMQHVYMIPTHYQNPSRAAKDYADTIRELLGIGSDAIPQFDLLYLGLGTNAHTASLMPGTDLVKSYVTSPDGEDKSQITAAAWIEELNMDRITLTPPAINNSACIAFLVEGTEKAHPVWQIIEGPHDPVNCPAQLVKGEHGKLLWFLDKDSAADLKGLK